MIKFKQYINEGLIKVPEETLKELRSVVIGNFVAYIVEHYGAAVKSADIRSMTGVIEVAEKSFNFDLDNITPIKFKKKKSFTVKWDVNSLPDNYKHLFKNTNKKKIKVEINFAKTRDNASGYYDHNNHKIVFQLGRLLDINIKNKKVKSIDVVYAIFNLTKRLNNTIEHELMHSIQVQLIKNVDAKQAEIPDDYDEKYFTSDIEFQPLILTVFGRYDYFIRKAMKENKKSDIVNRISNESEFFIALKKDNITRWKKAVKLLSIEIDNRYK